MSKTAIGSDIYRLRKNLRWTQATLADKVGVSRAAISQFEKGENLPSAETLEKLSEAFGEKLEISGPMVPKPEVGATLPYVVVATNSAEEFGRLVSGYLQQGYLLRGPMLTGARPAVFIQNLVLPGIEKEEVFSSLK